MNAFLYLFLASARNRFGAGLKRARRPRYGVALLVGGIYVWLFLFRPTGRDAVGSFLLGQPTEMLVTLIALLTLMGSWIFGSDATALAFSEAEVSMLFPAPLRRRGLIEYKLLRAQITVLLNALVWVFILRRGGSTLSPLLRAIALWAFFSVLNLHRLGAALVRTSWREHGRAGARRHWVSVAVFAVLIALVAAGLVQSRRELLGAPGLRAFFAILGGVLASAPAYWGLFLFHLAVAPMFARSTSEWARLIVPAFGVLAVHAWWVLRTDSAFEDAAIDASAKRARRLEATRSRRSGAATRAPRAAASTLRLSADGHPAVAILWKNMLCLRRTAQLHVFVGPAAMAIALGAATTSAGADGPEVVANCAIALAGMLFLFGGRLIRNDLRHDMLHLPLIKSLPVSPGDVIIAEVASSAVPAAIVQLILILLAYVAASLSANDPLGADTRLAILVASPFALLALNGALLTIQNGTALLFPDWIRLGPVVNTGVEALGQNVLGMIANLISLGVGLVIPLGIATGIILSLGVQSPAGWASAAILAAVILTLETYGATRILGGILGRAEPAQTV